MIYNANGHTIPGGYNTDDPIPTHLITTTIFNYVMVDGQTDGERY